MKHSDAVALGRCASGRGWSGDCENGEVVDGDLVISKLVVEVDSRFGEYGMCNICVNGTDPLSRLPCATGEYICACPKYDRFRRRPVFEVCEGPACGDTDKGDRYQGVCDKAADARGNMAVTVVAGHSTCK